MVTAAKLVIIRYVAVVNDGEVGKLVAAKRLRMTEVNLGFSGKPGVADSVRALELGDSIGQVQVGRRTDLLDDLQALTHADHFDLLIQRFNAGGEDGQVFDPLNHQAGGVAIIRVGAATETEMKEKKARVEDALHATRAAVEEGIVPGGGVALLRSSKALHGHTLEGDEQIGLNIVRRACEEPLRQIVLNSGHEGAIVVEKVRLSDNPNFGYNAATDQYEDLIVAGVIDPTKVTRTALENAASIASLMLTTEAMICEIPEKKSAPAGRGAGPGEGMDY